EHAHDVRAQAAVVEEALHGVAEVLPQVLRVGVGQAELARELAEAGHQRGLAFGARLGPPDESGGAGGDPFDRLAAEGGLDDEDAWAQELSHCLSPCLGWSYVKPNFTRVARPGTITKSGAATGGTGGGIPSRTVTLPTVRAPFATRTVSLMRPSFSGLT